MESSSALIIIDVQNEFMSSDGNFPISDVCKPDLVTNLKALIPRFRQSIGHIIWVKAIYDQRTEEPEEMKKHEKGDGILGNNDWLTVATHVHPTPCCEAGSFGAEIYPEVFALADPKDAIVTKGGYSAFNGTTALKHVLREKGVTNVYFCGVASGTCVLATVIDAVKLGNVQIHVVPECMGWRRYNTHKEAIKRFEELKVNLVTIDQLDIDNEIDDNWKPSTLDTSIPTQRRLSSTIHLPKSPICENLIPKICELSD